MVKQGLIFWSLKMNMLNKSVVCGLGCLMFASSAMADVVEPQAQPASDKSVKYEKTSDVGTVIFRIENIQPVKNKEGSIMSCSFVVTVYNRLDTMVKEANLNFVWQDNITGQYLKRIDESSKLNPDEITSNFSSDFSANEPSSSLKGPGKFKPIIAPVKLFNIAPHSQKSFSNSVDTDKCFLLFDNLNYTIESCSLEGDEAIVKDNEVIRSADCKDKFNYINSKNPEYYVEFGDVPENIVQDQVEEEKQVAVEKISDSYDEISEALDKVDTILNKMR